MSRQSSPRYRILAAAAMTVGAIVALLIFEAAVRLLGLAPLSSQYGYYVPDPVLPFRLASNIEFNGRSDGGEYEYTFRHNSLGYRDVERPLAKAPGTFRILGIGDSFTYGVGAEWEDTYLRRVEKFLQGHGPRVEVIKAGIPRSFPEAERIQLENEGLRFQPDLVLVGFVANDVIDTDQGLDAVTVDASGYLKTKEAAMLGRWGTSLYLNSHAVRLILEAWIGLRSRLTQQSDWQQVYMARGRYEKAWQKIETEYSRMTALARSHGAGMALLYIPDKPSALQYFRVQNPNYPRDRLRAWATRENVLFIDPTEAMIEAGRTQSLYWEKDPHCNAYGYAVIASTIVHALGTSGALPWPYGSGT